VAVTVSIHMAALALLPATLSLRLGDSRAVPAALGALTPVPTDQRRSRLKVRVPKVRALASSATRTDTTQDCTSADLPRLGVH
jgi:hypothetical protein